MIFVPIDAAAALIFINQSFDMKKTDCHLLSSLFIVCLCERLERIVFSSKILFFLEKTIIIKPKSNKY